MECIYVISTEDSASRDEYKVGRHSGCVSKLMWRYRTYLRDPVLYGYMSCQDSIQMEKNAFDILSDMRMKDARGKNTEWVKCPLADIMKCIVEVISQGIAEATADEPSHDIPKTETSETDQNKMVIYDKESLLKPINKFLTSAYELTFDRTDIVVFEAFYQDFTEKYPDMDYSKLAEITEYIIFTTSGWKFDSGSVDNIELRRYLYITFESQGYDRLGATQGICGIKRVHPYNPIKTVDADHQLKVNQGSINKAIERFHKNHNKFINKSGIGDYLELEPFDVDKIVAIMGLVCKYFVRKPKNYQPMASHVIRHIIEKKMNSVVSHGEAILSCYMLGLKMESGTESTVVEKSDMLVEVSFNYNMIYDKDLAGKVAELQQLPLGWAERDHKIHEYLALSSAPTQVIKN